MYYHIIWETLFYSFTHSFFPSPSLTWCANLPRHLEAKDPSSEGLLSEAFEVFLGYKVNTRRYIHRSWFHLVNNLVISQMPLRTRGNWLGSRNRSSWNRLTSLKHFFRSPWVHGQQVNVNLRQLKFISIILNRSYCQCENLKVNLQSKIYIRRMNWFCNAALSKKLNTNWSRLNFILITLTHLHCHNI